MNFDISKLKATPLYVKVLFIVVLLLGLLYILKPNAYKDFYRLFNKELKQQEVISKKTYDSLENVRKMESLQYETKIRQKDIELDAISIQLQLQKQKAYRYEKELNNYIRGDFDERFRIFTNLVKEDSIR